MVAAAKPPVEDIVVNKPAEPTPVPVQLEAPKAEAAPVEAPKAEVAPVEAPKAEAVPVEETKAEAAAEPTPVVQEVSTESKKDA